MLFIVVIAFHSAQQVIILITIGSEFSNFYAYQLSTQASEAHGKTTQNPVLEPRLLLTCSNPFLLTLRISTNIIEPPKSKVNYDKISSFLTLGLLAITY